MGQYYRACFKKEEKKNIFVKVKELFSKKNVVVKNWNGIKSWDFDCGAKLMEHSYIGNPFVEAFMSMIYKNPMRVVWAGDYAENENGADDNIYGMSDDVEKDTIDIIPSERFKYLINHTKKCFVDLEKLAKSKEDWVINPLPLLTAEGNGQGGGDYFGKSDNESVGSWARDIISVDNEKPSIFYTEKVYNFSEEDNFKTL